MIIGYRRWETWAERHRPRPPIKHRDWESIADHGQMRQELGQYLRELESEKMRAKGNLVALRAGKNPQDAAWQLVQAKYRPAGIRELHRRLVVRRAGP